MIDGPYVTTTVYPPTNPSLINIVSGLGEPFDMDEARVEWWRQDCFDAWHAYDDLKLELERLESINRKWICATLTLALALIVACALLPMV